MNAAEARAATRRRSWTPRTYFVTARHRVRWGRDGVISWVPFERGHLRRAGDSRTACGEVAMDWPIFWDMPVGDDNDLCVDCTMRVLGGKNVSLAVATGHYQASG